MIRVVEVMYLFINSFQVTRLTFLYHSQQLEWSSQKDVDPVTDALRFHVSLI